jgi:hypothetical protein
MADRGEKRAAKADAAAEKARAKAERPWYKKKRIIIPLALLLLIIVVAVSGGGDDATQQVADGGNEAPEEADAPDEASDDAEFARMGEPAADGQFTFTVNSIDCGETTIGEDGPFQEEAQGEFCLLQVTVENTGNEARSLSASDQFLFDDQERRFSSDLSYALAADTPIFEQINPGNSLEGTIIFDVPEGATIEFAELHDSAFSGGVLVDLR